MIIKNYVKSFLALCFVLTISGPGTGCSRKITKDTPIQDMKKAPEWIKKGSGAFKEEKDKNFYGVGSAYGIRNYSLLRTAADDRAREEIAKVFQVYISSLGKDYAASITSGNFNATTEEQKFEKAIKTVTSVTLSGVEIIDHWEHPARGELYSLARLNLKVFKNNLEQMKELDVNVREYVQKNAEKLHEKLEEEENKIQK